MMRGGNREMRRMLDKMGLEMKEMGEIEEVVIRTEEKEKFPQSERRMLCW